MAKCQACPGPMIRRCQLSVPGRKPIFVCIRCYQAAFEARGQLTLAEWLARIAKMLGLKPIENSPMSRYLTKAEIRARAKRPTSGPLTKSKTRASLRG